MKLPKKISELPSVSTIKNADLFAIVQDGVTSNVTFTILEGVISGYTASADTYVTGGVYNSGTTSIDFTGNTDFPPFSVDVSDIGGIFTGNTSATCISDIYVSNIHSCSPLNINPLNEGNIFIGTGFTFDLTGNTDQRLGINTSIPQANLHIKGLTPPSGDTLFLLEDSVGNVVIGANDEGALSIGVDPYDITTSGSSSLFIKGDSSTSTGNSDDENIALRVMNSTNQDILLVKNGGRVGASGNIQDGRVGINCAFHSGGPFLPDDTIFYVRGDDAGVSATGDAFRIADADTNVMVEVQNDATVLLSRSLENGKVKIGGILPAAKLHIALADTWQDVYGETMALRIDGLSDVAPFTANTSNIFTIDNFGNTNILKRTTTENFTMTSGATDGYILTSDASGNASWEESISIQEAKLVILSGDVLQLNTTPQQIIATPGSGKIIDVIDVVGKIDYGTTDYDTNTTLALKFTGATDNMAQEAGTSPFLSMSNSAIKKINVLGTTVTNTQIIENESLYVTVNTGDPANGDSTITIYVTYKITTL